MKVVDNKKEEWRLFGEMQNQRSRKRKTRAAGRTFVTVIREGPASLPKRESQTDSEGR